ncbi:hypothetical protein [Microbacterium oleivorans]|uniref:Uncharacterized protein n=1 Tax=Microbacterium oleivorans TaxID=273677 RepID=A0A7D5IRN3_9MICO|nr:hypothetical protein [Microbacterium oleivorans]QLD12959.1 hypothetical protein HW566_14930 [Microbacterium oleivorans]
MNDSSTPNHRDADDAHADNGAPTDAVSDEVKVDAARAGADSGDADDNTGFPQDPSISHP